MRITSMLQSLGRTWFVGTVSLVCILMGDTAPTSGADWPMRGRGRNRNAVVPDGVGPTTWQLPSQGDPGKNIRWSVDVGHYSQGDPVISGGLVWIGTNNGRPRDPNRKEDAGVLMCFDERDGKFLYQYVSPRLKNGQNDWNRYLDWPTSSQTGSPLIENDRLWFCNNRREVICLDIAPLLTRTGEPKVVWKVDMIGQFGIVPRAHMMSINATHCSIAGYQDLIYVNTSNAGGFKKAPDAPSLICFEKHTGKVKWQDKSPGNNLLDVQGGSPLIIEIQGRGQVIMGQGDGWVRGFDALSGEVMWKFDINFKSTARGPLLARDRRNDLVTMPVFYDGRVYFAAGKNIELGDGPGRMCCLDPTKRGDISSELDAGQGRPVPNPNSGMVWQYVRFGAGKEDIMHSTISSVAIHEGLVLASDTFSYVHCVDAATGAPIWTHDTIDAIWSSPLIVGNRVYQATESNFVIFELSRQKKVISDVELEGWSHCAPAFANGVLFLLIPDKLLAIGE